MNQDIEQALMSMDVPANRIHMEQFGGPAKTLPEAEMMSASVSLTLTGQTHTLRVEKGQSILQAAQRAGIPMPFRCQSGVCGTCKAHLKSGKIHMPAHMALDEQELARDIVLTCQSYPISETVSLGIAAEE